MTVRELLQQLSDKPLDSPVVIRNPDQEGWNSPDYVDVSAVEIVGALETKLCGQYVAYPGVVSSTSRAVLIQ